jgi:hypothetical protein
MRYCILEPAALTRVERVMIPPHLTPPPQIASVIYLETNFFPDFLVGSVLTREMNDTFEKELE